MQRERLAYSQEVRDIPAEDLIALDQTGVWEGMERGVARSLRGQRAYHYRQRYKGEKHTVIGAISLRGVVGCRVIKGGMKKGDFFGVFEKRVMSEARGEEGCDYGQLK